jgi:hypothetical protein
MVGIVAWRPGATNRERSGVAAQPHDSDAARIVPHLNPFSSDFTVAL